MFRLPLALFFISNGVLGDVYMHNPRGSNDRNCERNVNRNNGNRLFDSQNNNNGGYACDRGVGDEDFQPEDDQVPFTDLDSNTGEVETFYQSKRIYYYEGSILPIEWTNQHGCGGNSKLNCEMVIQYACEDTLDPRVDNFWPWVNKKAEEGTEFYGKQHFRSGSPADIAAPRDGIPRDANDAATDTIPDNEASAIPNTKETRRFGMQENYDYYQLCQRTQRNKGLYTADQRVKRNDRRGTRQNPNGNRNGLECPEERDYYPWWAPSPWIDIAVLTDSAADDVCYYDDISACSTRCQYYMRETMNFNKKGYCDVDRSDPDATVQKKLDSNAWNNRQWYNNKEACEENGFAWYMVAHNDNLALANNSFVCAKTQFSRANQLGNGRADSVVSQTEYQSISGAPNVVNSAVVEGVNANRFLWTIPNIPTASTTYFDDMTRAYKQCVIRLRYNTSTADFQQYPIDAVDAGAARMVDSKNNSQSSYDPNTPLHQNPYVTIGPGDSATKGDMFVKLKVNTNQYGRTFQDRSYVFTIKPLPTTDTPQSNKLDAPPIDATQMQAKLAAGGKIYNVNVRGKRGNIVQVYPSVEYDFVPNMLALETEDMIHFQWTGSDYNPRRGCNDATGGPPDANTFSTDANANKNPRADRHNLILTDHMGNNVPKDYLGYDPNNVNLTYAEKEAFTKDQLLASAPCYDPATDSQATKDDCYDQLVRLAYLNQQSDVGSLILRANKPCLTQDELNEINNEDVADFHPLNCAKINAKPHPYFDAGIMFLKKAGWFPFFSSRNNNFSNRQQIGILCVGPSCTVDASTGVLQDVNPQNNGQALSRAQEAKCYDNSDTSSTQSNANGIQACITDTPENSVILSTETFTTSAQDNDNFGDGNAQGCAVLANMPSSNSNSGLSDEEESVAVALSLLFVGLFLCVLAYCLYVRYKAREEESNETNFRENTNWQKAGNRKSTKAKTGGKEWLKGGSDKTATSSRKGRPASYKEEANPYFATRSQSPGRRTDDGLEMGVRPTPSSPGRAVSNKNHLASI